MMLVRCLYGYRRTVSTVRHLRWYDDMFAPWRFVRAGVVWGKGSRLLLLGGELSAVKVRTGVSLRSAGESGEVACRGLRGGGVRGCTKRSAGWLS